ncbi:hypothetical protein QBC43DRAFT_64105 [Cladorrhinum sp. PSN259]|nr:hypothetical protein QBC43DRAFT_64105 [Cladorrhinum sp. PSN259]
MAPAPNSNISSEQLGAILGSVLGFTGLVLLLCCCIAVQRKRGLRTRNTERVIYVGHSESDFSGSEMEVEYTRQTSQRVPNYGRQGHFVVGARGGSSFGGPPRRTDAGFTTVPPPVRFPPTPRYTNYVQTPYPQISGVQRYP